MTWNEFDSIIHDGTEEQIDHIRCPECDSEKVRLLYFPKTRNMEIFCLGCGTGVKAHGVHKTPNFALFGQRRGHSVSNCNSRTKHEAEKSLQRFLALEYAKTYCDEKSLSFEKLCSQGFHLIYNEAIFAQSSDVVPNGLLNDMETMPMPTLLIKSEDGRLVIEETEHTRQFLSI